MVEITIFGIISWRQNFAQINLNRLCSYYKAKEWVGGMSCFRTVGNIEKIGV